MKLKVGFQRQTRKQFFPLSSGKASVEAPKSETQKHRADK